MHQPLFCTTQRLDRVDLTPSLNVQYSVGGLGPNKNINTALIVSTIPPATNPAWFVVASSALSTRAPIPDFPPSYTGLFRRSEGFVGREVVVDDDVSSLVVSSSSSARAESATKEARRDDDDAMDATHVRSSMPTRSAMREGRDARADVDVRDARAVEAKARRIDRSRGVKWR